MQVKVLGMVWYRPEDYDRIRAMFVDGNKLPRTYDEWLTKAELGRKELRSSGRVAVVRVVLDPDDFAEWCRAKNLKLDEHARTQFAANGAHDRTRERFTSELELEAAATSGGDVFVNWDNAHELIPHAEGADRVEEMRAWASKHGAESMFGPPRSESDVRPEWVMFERPAR